MAESARPRGSGSEVEKEKEKEKETERERMVAGGTAAGANSRSTRSTGPIRTMHGTARGASMASFLLAAGSGLAKMRGDMARYSSDEGQG